MYHLATKHSKNKPPKLTHSDIWRKSKMQTAQCPASGTMCEQEVLPLSTYDVNKQ